MKEWRPLAQTFFFDSFSLEGTRVLFSYSTDAGHVFQHVLTLPRAPERRAEELSAALFALGMAELAHYWKAILAPRIIVRAGALSDAQRAFWENLYIKGLGEFFFVNEIDFRGIVKIESTTDAPALPVFAEKGMGILVPFGGGKDSLVTGEMLARAGKNFSWFELERLPFSGKLMEVSGTTDTIVVGRNVLKNFSPVIELIKQGAPNGHVPITATYMFSAVLAAQAYGYADIVLSLERSADFGNVEYLGMTVNHQYSKSFEFEHAASSYVVENINPGIRLFSLLRPLYEIQIIKEFADFPQYFPLFISCNRGLATSTWCGTCAKCAFMFAGLSVFLSPEVVFSIFKKNLFEDASLVPVYRDMIGKGAMKPFDCVGTFEENMLALYLVRELYRELKIPLPVVLVSLPLDEAEQYMHLLTDFSTEHNIPADYQDVWKA